MSDEPSVPVSELRDLATDYQSRQKDRETQAAVMAPVARVAVELHELADKYDSNE